MAKKKNVKTPVRSLAKQAEKMGLPKISGQHLYLGTSGTDHKPAVDYTELSDTKGYPRGFNPEQMKDVKAAEESGGLTITSDADPAWANRRVAPWDRAHPKEEESKIRETIARSNVNAQETFTDPVTVTMKSRIGNDTSALGLFQHKDEIHNDTGSHQITVVPNADSSSRSHSTRTRNFGIPLIHEIGHYADKEGMNELVEHSKFFGVVPEGHYQKGYKLSGTVEGRADAFANAMYVGDPRQKNERVTGSYPVLAAIRSRLTGERGHSAAKNWASGYLAEAPEAPIGDPRYEDASLKAVHIGDDYVEGTTLQSILGRRFLHPRTGTPVEFGGLINYLSGKEDA
jgi:hypothetical protein